MMVVAVQDRGFCLGHMDECDLRSLRSLIKSGGLEEGRKWYRILKEIESILKEK